MKCKLLQNITNVHIFFQMQVSASQTALLAIVTVRNLASLTTVAARMMVRSPPLPQETTVDVIPPNPSHPAFKSSRSSSR